MTETLIIKSRIHHQESDHEWCKIWMAPDLYPGALNIEPGPATTSFLLAYAQPGRETAMWRAKVCDGVATGIVRVSEATP